MEAVKNAQYKFASPDLARALCALFCRRGVSLLKLCDLPTSCRLGLIGGDVRMRGTGMDSSIETAPEPCGYRHVVVSHDIADDCRDRSLCFRRIFWSLQGHRDSTRSWGCDSALLVRLSCC